MYMRVSYKKPFPPSPSLKISVPFLDAAKPFFSLWQNHALYNVITTDNTGQKEIHSSPVVLLREENLLRWVPAPAMGLVPSVH